MIKTASVALICLAAQLVIPCQVGAQPTGPIPPGKGLSVDEAVEQVLWEGINAMYSYRFDEASKKFRIVVVMDSANVVAPFVALANRWLQSQTEDGYLASHDVLFKAIDATIPLYEKMLDEGDDRPEVYLYLGSSYGLRARVALAGKKWSSVIYSGYNGLRFVQKAYAADSTLQDAFLPLGVFDYYAGASSAPVQFAAKLFGVNPDRNAGISSMQQAAEYGRYSWIEAASTLSILYLYIEDIPEQAIKYTRGLLERYPENYYFSFLYGEELVQLGRLSEAREFISHLKTLTAGAHSNQQLEWSLKLVTLESSLCLAEGDTATALSKSQWVIDNYEMEFDWHLGIALYIRGTIRENSGNIEGAIDDYKTVIKLDNRTYVIKLANKRLRNFDAD